MQKVFMYIQVFAYQVNKAQCQYKYMYNTCRYEKKNNNL